MESICIVVSPHGFGHAARACAVIEAMARQAPDLRFEILTTVPEWFFEQSLDVGFAVRSEAVDVGVVQRSPFEEDLGATLRRLDELYGSPEPLAEMTHRMRSTNCRGVVCDISPLGLAAAARLGLTSVLVSNFTWDWIYEGYGDGEPGLRDHARSLARIFSSADLHVQTEPVCCPSSDAQRVPPTSRRPRIGRSAVRHRLELSDNAKVVLVSMGGVPWTSSSYEALRRHPRLHFVVPGGSDAPRRDGSLTLIPYRSDLYHPDLVHASDLVVGKLGYSTLAEAYHAVVPMLFVERPAFRESRPLAAFAKTELAGVALSLGELEEGSWLDQAEELLDAPRPTGDRVNGADQAAELILESLALV
jgi:hypothetical protein